MNTLSLDARESARQTRYNAPELLHIQRLVAVHEALRLYSEARMRTNNIYMSWASWRSSFRVNSLEMQKLEFDYDSSEKHEQQRLQELQHKLAEYEQVESHASRALGTRQDPIELLHGHSYDSTLKTPGVHSGKTHMVSDIDLAKLKNDWEERFVKFVQSTKAEQEAHANFVNDSFTRISRDTSLKQDEINQKMTNFSTRQSETSALQATNILKVERLETKIQELVDKAQKMRVYINSIRDQAQDMEESLYAFFKAIELVPPAMSDLDAAGHKTIEFPFVKKTQAAIIMAARLEEDLRACQIAQTCFMDHCKVMFKNMNDRISAMKHS